MAETQVREKTDWVTPLSIVIGGGILIGGILFYLKGQKAYKPGDTMEATFNFEYRGPLGSYLLRIVLGNARPLLPFDEDEGTEQEYPVIIAASSIWEKHEETVEYKVPQFRPNVSDAEFSIRYPDGSIVSSQRYIIRDVVKEE